MDSSIMGTEGTTMRLEDTPRRTSDRVMMIHATVVVGMRKLKEGMGPMNKKARDKRARPDSIDGHAPKSLVERGVIKGEANV